LNFKNLTRAPGLRLRLGLRGRSIALSAYCVEGARRVQGSA